MISSIVQAYFFQIVALTDFCLIILKVIGFSHNLYRVFEVLYCRHHIFCFIILRINSLIVVSCLSQYFRNRLNNSVLILIFKNLSSIYAPFFFFKKFLKTTSLTLRLLYLVYYFDYLITHSLLFSHFLIYPLNPSTTIITTPIS